jgi:glycosyltransferase involved in cell wall biosynthesis
LLRETGVAVIVPAWNEEETIGGVVGGCARFADLVVVADNGSTDRTAARAAAAGANVVAEPRRGYGHACLAAIAWCAAHDPAPDLLVFADGDGADDPAQIPELIAPIRSGAAELVIGSRSRGEREPGALLPQARFGNWIACTWIRAITGVAFTDLGPFRAISRDALERLGMRDRNYGWTVEMQLKAARAGIRCAEIPVRYRRRQGGRSKVTGTIRGVALASAKILWCLARYSRWRASPETPETRMGDRSLDRGYTR